MFVLCHYNLKEAKPKKQREIVRLRTLSFEQVRYHYAWFKCDDMKKLILCRILTFMNLTIYFGVSFNLLFCTNQFSF